MSTKPKYIEPTPAMVVERKRVIETLCRLALETSSLSEEEAKGELGRIFRFAEGDGYSATFGSEEGDAPDVAVPQFSYMPVYRPHINAALRDNNLPLAACLALSVYFGQEYERHMPAYGQMILGKQRNARASATKRREEQNNSLALIEAYEREQGITLKPSSPAVQITACATATARSEVTILNALKTRARQG